MTNEIKEILDKPKILMLSYGNYISLNDYVKLKDCITNLQEENKRLHNRELELSYHLSLYSSEETMLKEINDLQQRIDKAVEYIKWNLDKNEELIEYFNYDANFNELLKILKGEE